MIDPFALVRAQVLGEGATVSTPYGVRRLTYVDHAASGRLYGPVERFLIETVAPFYGNTHTETTAVGAQTTTYREEARRVIRAAMGCTDEDAVIFTGNGVTGAVHTLIGCLGLAVPCCLKDRGHVRLEGYARPVVLLGAYEHHSNELPWRECEVDVEVVRDCDVDGINLDHLVELLQHHRGRRVIGSFSAASNVTGRLTDVPRVAEILHAHGALAFFDYAAAAPYVSVDMACMDAAFLSMHKFLGGPGAPGVLLAKRRLFTNRVPTVPGGGTVSTVGPHHHHYLADVEHREEGGTPDILGAIKAGLAMRLKESVGAAAILAHEQAFAARFVAALAAEPGVTVLGSPTAPRLGIVSFVIEHEAPVRVMPGDEVERGVACFAPPCPPDRGVVLDVNEDVAALVRFPATGGGPVASDGGLLHAIFGAGGAREVWREEWVPLEHLRPVQVTRCKALHHNFVVALLNDLFGIQARGGNSCAAPYAHRLLGVGAEDEAQLEACVAAGWAGCKPGWTRVSFGWYDSDDTLAFVTEAVRFVARHGWRLLDDYVFNPATGTWKHRTRAPVLWSLNDPPGEVVTLPEEVRWEYFADAEKYLGASWKVGSRFEPTPFEVLRWFWLPGEL